MEEIKVVDTTLVGPVFICSPGNQTGQVSTERAIRSGQAASEYLDTVHQIKDEGYPVLNPEPHIILSYKEALVSLARRAEYCVLLPGWEEDADCTMLAFNAVFLGLKVVAGEKADEGISFKVLDLQFSLNMEAGNGRVGL